MATGPADAVPAEPKARSRAVVVSNRIPILHTSDRSPRATARGEYWAEHDESLGLAAQMFPKGKCAKALRAGRRLGEPSALSMVCGAGVLPYNPLAQPNRAGPKG